MGKRLCKIEAMHYFYGCDPKGRVCIQCDYLIRGEYRDKRYYKCKVYGCTHCESTDWKISFPACSLIDKVFPDQDKRIIEILKHTPIQKEEQIDGQISINELMEG